MTAVHPLPDPTDDDLDVFPMDDAYLATLPAEDQAAIRGAEERIANGTARLVSHAEVMAEIERQRPAAG